MIQRIETSVMIDKLNDKPAATIGLLVGAVSVGRSLGQKGEREGTRRGEEKVRGKAAWRTRADRKRVEGMQFDGMQTKFILKLCAARVPPFRTLCLRDLTRDDRESDGRGKRGGEAEERS